jgi:hypothetical protein
MKMLISCLGDRQRSGGRKSVESGVLGLQTGGVRYLSRLLIHGDEGWRVLRVGRWGASAPSGGSLYSAVSWNQDFCSLVVLDFSSLYCSLWSSDFLLSY